MSQGSLRHEGNETDRYLLEIIKRLDVGIINNASNVIGVNKLVFKSKVFNGDGISTTFLLDSTVPNVIFTTGSWNVANIDLASDADIVNTDGGAIYDGIAIFGYNTGTRIKVSSISALGLVTTNVAPKVGEQVCIYYWYNIDPSDVIDNYYRDDIVTRLEADVTNLVNTLNDIRGKSYNSATDTTLGYLNNKLSSTNNSIVFNTINPSVNEILNLQVSTDFFNKTIDTSDNITEGTTNLFNRIPTGGTVGQVLSKVDGTNFNLQWSNVVSGITDHTLLTNIGVNSHIAIDSHISDNTLHFTEASINHGSIAGLGNDDHTQYHTDARALTWLSTRTTDDLPEGTTNLYNRIPSGGAIGQYIRKNGASDYDTNWATLPSNTDELVKVSATDTTTGYLTNKIIGTAGKIVVGISNPLADEKIVLTVGSNIFDKTVDTIPVHTSFTRNNSDHVQENSGAYTTVAKIIYAGSSVLGVPTSIIANVWNDGATSVDIRVIDATNGDVVIAELTGITSSFDGNIPNLGTLSNIPTGNASFEVQLALNGGGMGDQARISSLTIY